MFTLTGIITTSENQNPGWYRVEVDKEFSLYMMWLSKHSWNLPLNGPHVTFIAGNREERIITNGEMDSYLGVIINLRIIQEIWTDGRSYWMPVSDTKPDLRKIRESLNLPARPQGLHLTLGNNKSISDRRNEIWKL